MYGYPAIFVLGMAANLLSFVTILNSGIRQTSTGVYLSAMAVVDSFCLYGYASIVWAQPVLGRAFPPLHLCRVNVMCLNLFLTLSSLCVVCLTTDRFLLVWFPFETKNLTTRTKAGFVLLFVTCALLVIYLPALWALGPNCEPQPSMPSYTPAILILLNLTYSYGPAIYLFCVNIAIAIKIVFPPVVLQETTMSSARELQNYKIATTVLLVSFTFIVCTVPINVLLSLVAAEFPVFRDNSLNEEVAFTFCRFLALANHAVNFFLYVCSSSNFRRSLCTLFIGKGHDVDAEPGGRTAQGRTGLSISQSQM